MLKDPHTRIEDLIINSRTTMDVLLTAAANSDELPPTQPSPSDPAATNPAVARCCAAYALTLKAAPNQGKGGWAAELRARKAYRSALPPLSGADNIRDFIACVAHGMLIEAIDGSGGARLLYAAQVAHGAIPRPAPARAGRPAAS